MIKYTPEGIAELLKFETSRILEELGVWEYRTHHVRGTIVEKWTAVTDHWKTVRQLTGEQDD